MLGRKGIIEMAVYYIDGKYTNKDEVKISIDDRGYYFGDGVYEVIKVYDGELFTADEHISRLFASAEKINLLMLYDKSEVIQIARELIEKNQLKNGHVYMQVTRGASARQHHFPMPAVQAVLTAYTMQGERPVKAMETGVAVKSVEDIRWLRCDIKSLNLLGSVLAKEEAKSAGFEEAILHRDGVVTEGSSTNMFGVKDGVVHTHPVTNLILEGITRQVVLQVCDELGIPVEEKPFTLDEALQMDEMFYTSTTAEVMPIIQLDDHVIGHGLRGAITKKIQGAFVTKIPLKVEK